MNKFKVGDTVKLNVYSGNDPVMTPHQVAIAGTEAIITDFRDEETAIVRPDIGEDRYFLWPVFALELIEKKKPSEVENLADALKAMTGATEASTEKLKLYDSIRKEERLDRFTLAAMQGLCANSGSVIMDEGERVPFISKNISTISVLIAKETISLLDKEKEDRK